MRILSRHFVTTRYKIATNSLLHIRWMSICKICEKTLISSKIVNPLEMGIFITNLHTFTLQSAFGNGLQDLLVILKHSLRNYWKVLKKCFLCTTCRICLEYTNLQCCVTHHKMSNPFRTDNIIKFIEILCIVIYITMHVVLRKL